MRLQIYIFIFLFASCGTRKVERTETAIETKIETTKETETITINNSFAEMFNLVPIDTLQPAVLEIEEVSKGVKRYTIKNAVLRHENKTDNTIYQTSEKVQQIEDISVVVKEKQVQRKSNAFNWWFLLLLVAGYLLYRYFK
jgi:hypothetical protein